MKKLMVLCSVLIVLEIVTAWTLFAQLRLQQTISRHRNEAGLALDRAIAPILVKNLETAIGQLDTQIGEEKISIDALVTLPMPEEDTNAVSALSVVATTDPIERMLDDIIEQTQRINARLDVVDANVEVSLRKVEYLTLKSFRSRLQLQVTEIKLNEMGVSHSRQRRMTVRNSVATW